jgi:hypothetical protein
MSNTDTTTTAAPAAEAAPASPPVSGIQQTVDTDLQWLTNAEVFVTNAIAEIEAHFKAAVAAVEKAV